MRKLVVFTLVVLVAWSASEVLAATYADGFETGTLDPGWVKAGDAYDYPTIVTSADNNQILPHSGNYMAYTPQNYAVTFPCVLHSVGTPSAGTVTAYVNSDGFGISYNFTIAILGPDASTIRVMNSENLVYIQAPSGNVLTGITVTPRAWHEVKFIVSSTIGTDVYWDGTLILTGEMGIVAVNKIEFGTHWGTALAGYDDFSFVPATANGNVTTVTGTIVPDGYTGDPQNVSVKIELIRSGSVVRTVRTNLDAAGKFKLSVVPSDIYDVGFKTYGHRRTLLTNQTITGPTIDLGTVTLFNGDADGDNSVTSTDLAIILANMDQTGDL